MYEANYSLKKILTDNHMGYMAELRVEPTTPARNTTAVTNWSNESGTIELEIVSHLTYAFKSVYRCMKSVRPKNYYLKGQRKAYGIFELFNFQHYYC